jgi:hypothetical protein
MFWILFVRKKEIMVILFILIGSYVIRCIGADCTFIPPTVLTSFIITGTVELVLEGIAGYVKIYKLKDKGDPDK